MSATYRAAIPETELPEHPQFGLIRAAADRLRR